MLMFQRISSPPPWGRMRTWVSGMSLWRRGRMGHHTEAMSMKGISAVAEPHSDGSAPPNSHLVISFSPAIQLLYLSPRFLSAPTSLLPHRSSRVSEHAYDQWKEKKISDKNFRDLTGRKWTDFSKLGPRGRWKEEEVIDVAYVSKRRWHVGL